jgi:hypothetical protein
MLDIARGIYDIATGRVENQGHWHNGDIHSHMICQGTFQMETSAVDAGLFVVVRVYILDAAIPSWDVRHLPGIRTNKQRAGHRRTLDRASLTPEKDIGEGEVTRRRNNTDNLVQVLVVGRSCCRRRRSSRRSSSGSSGTWSSRGLASEAGAST